MMREVCGPVFNAPSCRACSTLGLARGQRKTHHCFWQGNLPPCNPWNCILRLAFCDYLRRWCVIGSTGTIETMFSQHHTMIYHISMPCLTLAARTWACTSSIPCLCTGSAQAVEKDSPIPPQGMLLHPSKPFPAQSRTLACGCCRLSGSVDCCAVSHSDVDAAVPTRGDASKVRVASTCSQQHGTVQYNHAAAWWSWTRRSVSAAEQEASSNAQGLPATSLAVSRGIQG